MATVDNNSNVTNTPEISRQCGVSPENERLTCPNIENYLLPLLGVDDGLLQNSDDLWSELVYSLLQPENGDDGGVDFAEVRENLQVWHLHVDLESGLGTQCRPRHILDVKPESVFRLQWKM